MEFSWMKQNIFPEIWGMHCLEFFYWKNKWLISQKILFWGYSKWLQIKKKESSKIEQRYNITFLVPKNRKQTKLFWRICEVIVELCSGEKKKNVYNRLNIVLSLRVWVEKTNNATEILQWPSDKKVPGAVVCKEDQADSLTVCKEDQADSFIVREMLQLWAMFLFIDSFGTNPFFYWIKLFRNYDFWWIWVEEKKLMIE